MFIKNSSFNVEISFLLDTKNIHLPNPQFIIKDLGIVIETGVSGSSGSKSMLDLSNLLKHSKQSKYSQGTGSLNSQKGSGNSNISGAGLKLGQELKEVIKEEDIMNMRE